MHIPAVVSVRTYSELIDLPDWDSRLRYLQTFSDPYARTFGEGRYLNQRFYHSPEWKRSRDITIARDLGRDLGVEGMEIQGKILVHHMNPMKLEDLIDFNPAVLDPEYLITVCHDTHNAIHYGFARESELIERREGDTKLW